MKKNQILYVLILSVGVFSLFTSIGLVAALLVDISSEFKISVAAAGQLLTISAAVWGLASLVIGPLADRFDRKGIVFGGLLITGLAMLGYGFSRGFFILIPLSILTGWGGAMSGPNILASVGDHFRTAMHGRIMALVNIGSPLASLLGVPLGVIIAARTDWRTGFFLLGGLLICTAAFGFLIAPSSKSSTTSDVKGYLSSFKQAFHQGSFKYLMLANILRQGAYWSTFTYIPSFLLESYALDTEGVAPILFIIAIGQLSGMLTGGVLADRFNKIKVCLLLGLLVGLTGSILMGLPNRLWLAVILGGLFTGCFGASQPPFFSTTVAISQTLRGTMMGIQGAFNHIGRSLGALFGGMVLVFWDYRMMGAICLVLSLTASAVFFRIAVHTGAQTIDHEEG